MRWRAWLAVWLAAAALVVSACGGIPLEDSPRVIAEDRVPEALARPTTTLRPGVDSGNGGVNADLFLLLDSATEPLLVPCSVPTSAGGSVEARARAVIEGLISLDPDTSDLCPDQLTNAVPSALVVLSVRLVVERDGNVLDLNLDRQGISTVEATQQRRAIAQLVFTATDVPGVSAVRFLADGEPISVPVENRTTEPGETLTPRDFPTLLAGTQALGDFLTALDRPSPATDTVPLAP